MANPPASPADLTTVAQVQLQGGFPQSQDPLLLQAMVTAISRHIYTRTGRRVLNGTQSLTDTYDGTGSDKLFVRDWPIQAVTEIKVFGSTVQASPDGVAPGWLVGDSYAASVVLLPGTAIGG